MNQYSFMNQYSLQKLTNGLAVLNIPMPGVSSVTVLVLVKAGTRFENKANNGISHFLEHMVFKGTKDFPTALKLSLVVDAVGAEFNAFTGKEQTGFYVKTSASHLNLALKVVSQLVFAPLLGAKELEVERGVILEEIRMYDDQPMAKVGRDFESLLYKDTPLGWMTLGREENIKTMSRQVFVDYMQEFYRPDNMVLAVCGQEKILQAKSFSTLVSKYFGGGKKTAKASKKRQVKFTFNQTKPVIKLIAKKTEQAHLCLGVRTFERKDPSRYALAILSAILGGGMSSRLFSEIREKRGLAYYVKSGIGAYLDNGYLVIQAGTEPKNFSQVVSLIIKEFKKISAGKFDSKELVKAKEYLKGQLILSLEDSQTVADLYAEKLLLENKVRTPEMTFKKLDQVGKNEIVQVAKKIFVNEKLNLTAILPKKVPVKLSF